VEDPGRGAVMFSIVLCTYNRSTSLQITLDSLAQLVVTPHITWELVVVDNNSKDATAATVRKFAAEQAFPVRYVFEERQGLSVARNTGIDNARGKYIIFTDDDVTFDGMWLARIAETFERWGCAGVGGRIVPVWNTDKPKWLAMTGPYKMGGAIVHFDLGDETKPLEHPAFGANMAFRRDLFDRYGGFRADLGRCGATLLSFEDSDFFGRLKEGGEHLMYVPNAVVYHPVTPERLQRAYFRKWHFQVGRAFVRRGGMPEDSRRYWGIPRYLFRQYASNTLKSWFSRPPDKRFYYKLQACSTAGSIVEAWQTRGRRTD
jgi:glycosyltransferase involved in cell wall biosynthesis